MPKTIDYPRTTYQSAWEVSEVVDDTGGKCSLEMCARKLDRKVSGSFKAILGSAVKFGLLTSKRELLTTTNLFRRIKHAYDKKEEIVYHREAFLHPPLFTQICRKFRNRELPVHMFDIMLIREFGVEEINAQNVAKAFVEGARMAGIMDERNVITDIDQLIAQQAPRRELAPGEMPLNLFRGAEEMDSVESTAPDSLKTHSAPASPSPAPNQAGDANLKGGISTGREYVPSTSIPDPVSALFGLNQSSQNLSRQQSSASDPEVYNNPTFSTPSARPGPNLDKNTMIINSSSTAASSGYLIHISGPGIDTQLRIEDTDDLEIVRTLLDKIRKQLS